MRKRGAGCLNFLGAAVAAAILLSAGAAPLRAATWFAAPGATGSGASAADPGDLRTLVETRAAAGDTVRLATGTYNVKAGRFYSEISIERPLFLVGAGRGKTILKCANNVGIFRMDASAAKPATAAIKAMTLLDGANYQFDLVKGSPTIENVEFLGSASTASLISRNGHPVIKKCVFKAEAPVGLSADTRGAPALVTGCLFSMPGGTGLDYVSVASGSVDKNTFRGNRVGIYVYSAETIYDTRTSAFPIINNIFRNNTWGISLVARFSGVGRCTIKGNTFQSNVRGLTGSMVEGCEEIPARPIFGGVRRDAQGESVEKSTVDGNRFISNTHGMVFSEARMTVINNLLTGHKETSISSAGGATTIAFNTVAGGKGDGISLEASGTTGDRSLVVNNIVVSNAGFGVSLDAACNRARLGGNDIFANGKGVIEGAYVDLKGNLTVSPKFKAGSYALAAGSPCIDKAIAAYATDHDITGAKRTKPDIGAYEYK